MLTSLLFAFLANDNARRAEAEAAFAEMKKTSTRDVIIALAQQIFTDPPELRPLAAVMLRGITVREPELLRSLDPTDAEQLRGWLLQGLEATLAHPNRRKVIDCIAANARLGQWPALYTLVGKLAGGDEVHVISALEIIEKLAEYTGPELVAHANELIPFIQPTLTSPIPRVVVASARAFLSMLFDIREPNSDIKSVLVSVIEVMKVVASSEMEDDLKGLVELIHGLAENNPSVLLAAKNTIFVLLKQIVAFPAFDNDIKVISMETLSELVTSRKTATYRDEAPALVAVALESLCVETDENEGFDPSNLERPARGAYDDRFGYGCDDGRFDTATTTFTLLTEVIDHNMLVSSCLDLASKMVVDATSWRRRRAALMVTSILAEECNESLYPYRAQLTAQLVLSSQDQNMKVRYASMYALESFINFFTMDDESDDEEGRPTYQEESHVTVLPAILAFIQTNIGHPYLLHRGLSALRVFLDPNFESTSSIIHPTYDVQIIEAMLHLASGESYSLFVKEEAFKIMSNTFALSPQDSLMRFSSVLVPMYSGVIDKLNSGQASSSLDMSNVYGACLESLAFYSKNVDFEVVREVSLKFLHFGMSVFNSSSARGKVDYSDPLTSYIHQACVRLAGAMGNGFYPFLVNIIPPLLFHVSEEIPISIDIDDVNASEEGISIHKRGLGNVKLNFNSFLVTERETSCRVLVQYLLDVPQLLWQFTPDIVESVFSLSNQSVFILFLDEMLTVTGSIMFESLRVFLIYCQTSPTFPAIDLSSSTFANFSSRTLSAADVSFYITERGISFLLKIVKDCILLRDNTVRDYIKEDDFEKLNQAFDQLREMLLTLHRHKYRSLPRPEGETFELVRGSYATGLLFTDALVEEMLSCTLQTISLWIKGRFNAREGQLDMTDIEDELWLNLTDVIGWLVQLAPHQLTASPSFAQLQPFLSGLLTTSLSKISDQGLKGSSQFLPLISMPLQVTCEIMETSRSSAACSDAIVESFLQLHGIGDGDFALLCTNGLGILSMYGPQSFDSRCQDVAGLLCSFLENFPGVKRAFPSDDDSFTEKLNESALISLFKLATFRDHALQGGASSILQYVLSALPFQTSSVEVRKFHRLFIYMVSQQDKLLFKDDSSIMTRIVVILRSIYDEVNKESLALAIESGDSMKIVEFWENEIVDDESWSMLHSILSKLSY